VRPPRAGRWAWLLALIALAVAIRLGWQVAMRSAAEPTTPVAIARAGLPHLLEQVRAEPRSIEARLDLAACYTLLDDRIGAWQQLALAESFGDAGAGTRAGALAELRRMRVRTAEALRQLEDATGAAERARRDAPPEDPAPSLELHRLLTLEGDFDRALAVAQDSLARYSSDPRVLAAAGEASFNIADYPRAIQILRAARAAAPGDLPVSTQLGLAMIRAGQEGEAMAVLGEVVASPAAPPQAWEFLGQAQLAAGRATEAGMSLRRAEEQGAPGGGVAFGQARAALAQGRKADAETALERALTRDPAHRAAAVLLAQLLRARGARPESEAVLGRSALAMGEADAAIAHLRAAAGLDPRNVRRWRELAGVLQASEDGPGARAALRRAQALAPADPDVAAQQIETALALFAPQEALRGCDRFGRLFPSATTDIEWWRFRAYRQLQDTARARAALQAAAAAAPDRPELLAWQGRTLLERAPTAEQRAEAERFLRRALALQPDDPEVLGSLAEICMQQQRWEEAGSLLRRALARNPRAETPWLQLARVDRALRRAPEAEWDTARYRDTAARRQELARLEADAAARPRDGRRRAAHAWAALKANQLPEAWRSARLAVRLAPGEIQGRRALAAACQRLGRLEDRIAAMEAMRSR
jgi:Flp pilus assembly protein TadD